MAKFNDSQWRRDNTEFSLNEAYYVWSGTYGKDDPRKMKDLVKVKDLAASIKQSKIHQAKHGNMRAMLDREFAKQFPKAFKSLDEKRDVLQGDIEEGTRDNLTKAIPDNYNILKFAEDVAAIVKEQYGSHNVQPFLDRLKRTLK